MAADNDPLHLTLPQDVAYGDHGYGNSDTASLSGSWYKGAMPVRNHSQGAEKSLEQAPPTKLLNDQEVLDKSTIGKLLECYHVVKYHN